MDELKKFGDFLDDDILEVEPIEDDNVPSVIGSYLPPDDSPKSEEQIESAFSKLSKKYGLDLENISVKDVLDNVDKIETDDSSFDLVASKIVTDYVGRVALKGIITEARMLEKVFALMDNVTFHSCSGDDLLVLSKAFEYQDKLFSIIDRYKKAGVSTSLKHIAEGKKKSQEDEEKKVTLSHAELREIVDALRSGGEDESKSS